MKTVKNKGIAALIALALTVASVLSALTACSPLPKEEDVLAQFKELYGKSLIINEYIWGEGLPTKEHTDGQAPLYIMLADDSPYLKKDEFKAAICEVYAKSYVDNEISKYLFDGYGSSSAITARYSVDDNGYLAFDVKSDGEDVSGRFLTDTATVKEITADKAVISCDYERYDMGVKTFTLTMVLENNRWRFDQTTR